MKSGFKCKNCQKQVSTTKFIGTQSRNHCPYCLYSLHVDENISGDRRAICHGLMEPVGLTFKQVGLDKWGKEKQGELMLIHRCLNCTKISINRIASDDIPSVIMDLFTKSQDIDLETKEKLEADEITLLTDKDLPQIKIQLFGK